MKEVKRNDSLRKDKGREKIRKRRERDIQENEEDSKGRRHLIIAKRKSEEEERKKMEKE